MLQVFFGNDAVAVRKKAFACASVYEEDGFVTERIEAESTERDRRLRYLVEGLSDDLKAMFGKTSKDANCQS